MRCPVLLSDPPQRRLQYHLFLDTISMHIQNAPASCVPFFACMHVCAVSLGVLIRDCLFDLCEPGGCDKIPNNTAQCPQYGASCQLGATSEKGSHRTSLIKKQLLIFHWITLYTKSLTHAVLPQYSYKIIMIKRAYQCVPQSKTFLINMPFSYAEMSCSYDCLTKLPTRGQ